ncbi:MAG: hypothetical protein HDR95_06935 [Bacteroides sp.]|nr:hypothetical protein [Bacteroides sp.]MBD5337025.1 hypothetical protein [Bacteroides sp.]
MQLQITFQEISRYLSSQFSKNIQFSYISASEFKIIYRQKVLIAEVPISLDVKIEEVNENRITFSFSGKMGIDTIMRGFLGYCKSKFPKIFQAFTLNEGRSLTIDFTRLKETRNFIETVNLHSVTVTESGFTVLAALK